LQVIIIIIIIIVVVVAAAAADTAAAVLFWGRPPTSFGQTYDHIQECKIQMLRTLNV
jgi:uncharacterized protein YpuA (DUF1002 family)